MNFISGKDTYFVGTPAEMTSHHGCQEGQGVVALQFGRSLKYETVGAVEQLQSIIIIMF